LQVFLMVIALAWVIKTLCNNWRQQIPT